MINLNSRNAFVQPDGTLTKYGSDTILSIFGVFPGSIGFATKVALDAVDSKTDGSVTVHSDVTSAGSGQIITAAERTLLNSALQSETNTSLTYSVTTLTYQREAGANQTINLAATLLPLSGGTMTGDLILNANPTDPLGAATKQSVDAVQTDVNGFNDNLKNLTTTEINQLLNIDSISITNAQWQYLGDMNQSINTTDDVVFNALTISTPKTPSSAADTGVTGEITWDNDYIYVCVATDTWKRVAISTW